MATVYAQGWEAGKTSSLNGLQEGKPEAAPMDIFRLATGTGVPGRRMGTVGGKA